MNAGPGAARRGACLVGIGETRYAKWGGIAETSEYQLAIAAIQAAVADAGLSMDDVDGLASFADDRNDATFAAADLGLPELRYATMSWLPGGGGACAAIANASMAVETGAAEVVVVYRSLCQGQFHRFGQGPGGRPTKGPARRSRDCGRPGPCWRRTWASPCPSGCSARPSPTPWSSNVTCTASEPPPSRWARWP